RPCTAASLVLDSRDYAPLHSFPTRRSSDLKRLDAQAVQGRGTVEQHRVVADDLVEDVPHLGTAALDHALGGLDVGRVALVDELADRKSTRLNSSHGSISYAVFCLKKQTI